MHSISSASRLRRGRWPALIALVMLATSEPVLAKTTDRSDHLQSRLRVETIAYTISKANVDKCLDPLPLTGLILHDLASYDATDRPKVIEIYGLGRGAGVMEVIPDSPAAIAGIRPHDEIIAMDDQQIADLFPPELGNTKTADRVEMISAWIGSALKISSRRLTIRRDGKIIQVTLAADFGCGGRMAYMPTGSVNAWSDGQYVAVTQAMIDFSRNDDELAFVVAHEMAHNLLRHNVKANMLPSATVPGMILSPSHRKEMAADTFATELLYRTQYNSLNASLMFKRTVLSDLLDLGLTHPLSFQRIATIRKATAQLQQRDSALILASLLGQPSEMTRMRLDQLLDELPTTSVVLNPDDAPENLPMKKAAAKFATAYP